MCCAENLFKFYSEPVKFYSEPVNFCSKLFKFDSELEVEGDMEEIDSLSSLTSP